ncbi:MAG: STAS domain-containing protein [Planctomycetota bacterium]|nr:STAS domain-containing protein [Planctomycetota bacterium]
MPGVKMERLPDGRARLDVRGDVTSYTFQVLQEALDELISSGERRIILDMSKVDRLSSVGAGLLINAHGTCSSDGGEFILLSPSESVRRVLEALGILDMFTVADSLVPPPGGAGKQ